MFRSFTGAASMALLKQSPLPCDLAGLGIDGINAICRKLKLRAVGMKRAKSVYDAAKASIGCKQGLQAARMELRILLEDYDAKHRQYDEIMAQVEALCAQIPEAEELLEIKGIGIVTIVMKADWNSYAESKSLKQAAAEYKGIFGFYPKTILADRSYPSRENRLCGFPVLVP